MRSKSLSEDTKRIKKQVRAVMPVSTLTNFPCNVVCHKCGHGSSKTLLPL
jgi:hypothetical protein